MDSFEWNKIAGAVLATVMVILVIKFASEAIFEAPNPAKPGYVVAGVTEETASSAASTAPAEETLPDFGTVLPGADTAAGQKVSARCEQCHDLSKGGPNKIGPNLWGVLGRPRATHEGFSYSSAMGASHDKWNFDTLFRFLHSPGSVVPGTKMSFAGIPSEKDRINLLAWLRTQSDSPLPIPAPAPAKPQTAPANNAPQTATPPGAAPKTPGASAPAAPGTPAPATPKKN
jgi:cytochrome c